MAVAANNPAVGTWKLVSSNGEEYQWTMTVKEEDGKLSGTLAGDPGEFPLVDPKVDGDKFTFKVTVGDNEYTVETKITGDKLEGTYKGADSQGTVKATKQT